MLKHIFFLILQPPKFGKLSNYGMTNQRHRSEGTCVSSKVWNDWETTSKLSTALTDWLCIPEAFLSQPCVSAPLLAFFPQTDCTAFWSSLSWLQHWLPVMIPPMREEDCPISQYSIAGSRRKRVHMIRKQEFEVKLPLVINLTLQKQFSICIETIYSILPVFT